MSTSDSPTLAKLGEAVRRYRTMRGWSQEALARKINMSDSTISDIELAKVRPEEATIKALEEALELPEGALMDINDLLDGEESLPKWKREWFEDIEPKATVIRTFELANVAGLLQMRAYATALLRGNEAEIETRMRRQEILQKQDAPTLRIVLDEAVLHRPTGDRETMREQLEYLVAVQSQKITVQVLPYGVWGHDGLPGSFSIATVEGAQVGYLETSVRGMVTSDRNDLGKINGVWDDIQAYALPVGQSVALINKVAESEWIPET
jgi:transcriptional regulator with XRE-family HTH domain